MIDPATGVPIGVTGKITLREPRSELREAGLVSVDSLLEDANVALEQVDFTVWLVLDRLDVAFEQHEELEQNALRALFKAYLDMQSLEQIGIKISCVRTYGGRSLHPVSARRATSLAT